MRPPGPAPTMRTCIFRVFIDQVAKGDCTTRHQRRRDYATHITCAQLPIMRRRKRIPLQKRCKDDMILHNQRTAEENHRSLSIHTKTVQNLTCVIAQKSESYKVIPLANSIFSLSVYQRQTQSPCLPQVSNYPSLTSAVT